MEIASVAVPLVVQIIALALFFMGAGMFVVLVKGCFVLRRMARSTPRDYKEVLLKSPMVPAVSTIAIPRDASEESRQFTRRLLDLHFGRNEVVIVLDGPNETELETWIRELRLTASARPVDEKLPMAQVRGVYESRDPIRVVVVDKERGGVADAWNAGVNAASSPVIGILEPENEFEPMVLLRLIQPMLESYEDTVAVCGVAPPPPGEGMAAQFGALESLRAWLTRCAAYAERNMLLPIPGCGILVRRDEVVNAGGFTGGKLELFMRLHALALAAKKPYRIAFLPQPVSYRRVPSNFADLRRLVMRDQREIAAAYHNRSFIAGPWGWQALRELYGARSLRPKLEMALYLLAVFGLVAGWVDLYLALLVLLSTVAMGMVLSMGAVVLREVVEPNSADPRRMAAMFFAAIPENLGYRQMRNLWLIAGFRKVVGRDEKRRGKTAQGRPSTTPVSS